MLFDFSFLRRLKTDFIIDGDFSLLKVYTDFVSSNGKVDDPPMDSNYELWTKYE